MVVEVATETVAELPRPMVGPLLHSIFGRENRGVLRSLEREKWGVEFGKLV